jgi:signal transduction histidine kinase
MPRRPRDLLVDCAVALVALVLTLGSLFGPERGAADHHAGLLTALLAAFATLPLVVRRRFPLGVFAVTALASTVISALGYPHGPPIGPTVALFFLALAPEEVRAPPWLTAGTVVGFYAAHVAATGLADDAFPTVPLLVGVLVWGGAWVVGDRIRHRRERRRDVVESAARERRLAAAEERTRIARDLHDSAGHALNVILVQAGAARLLEEKDPARARAAIATIEEIARETVGDIDRLVSALREDGSDGAVEPPPGLAALDSLVRVQRASGLEVRVQVSGDRRAAPPGVDRAAYRILQEALTNAARHGAGGAEVELEFGPGALDLRVTNPVAPGTVPGAGHGLVGMRERAALLGGMLTAGPADGRFTVRAELPYDGGRL